jgi:hypothetical protein
MGKFGLEASMVHRRGSVESKGEQEDVYKAPRRFAHAEGKLVDLAGSYA